MVIPWNISHEIACSLRRKFHIFPHRIPCGIKPGPIFCRFALGRPLGSRSINADLLQKRCGETRPVWHALDGTFDTSLSLGAVESLYMYMTVGRNSSVQDGAIKDGPQCYSVRETALIQAGLAGKQQVRTKITHFSCHCPDTDSMFMNDLFISHPRLTECRFCACHWRLLYH